MRRARSRAIRRFSDCWKRTLKKWAQRYALEVRAQQVKPRAETAFREKRYAEAAELYGSIAEALSPTELKKLSFARSQK